MILIAVFPGHITIYVFCVFLPLNDQVIMIFDCCISCPYYDLYVVVYFFSLGDMCLSYDL